MTDLYRSNIGIMLVNNDNKIFVGKRIDMPSDAWQMPQGGIDEGEEPEKAVFREMFEETGIAKDKVSLIAVTSDWLFYDFPIDLKPKLFGGNYKGQKQKWFLLHFTGKNSDINLNATDNAEFSDYKWVNPIELPSLAISFKKEVYEKLLKEFGEYLGL